MSVNAFKVAELWRKVFQSSITVFQLNMRPGMSEQPLGRSAPFCSEHHFLTTLLQEAVGCVCGFRMSGAAERAAPEDVRLLASFASLQHLGPTSARLARRSHAPKAVWLPAS